MAPRRRQEFAQGRACARLALSAIGIHDVAIPRGPNREPVWPAGVTGSISHTDTCAAAAVAPFGVTGSLGLDLEAAIPLEDRLVDMICRPEELQRQPERDGELYTKLLFSIKESIFKCLWPHVRCYFDFLEMEVLLDPDGDTYRIRSHTATVEARLADRVQGRHARHGDLLISGAWSESR